jgi:methionyl aminopeptidase
VEETKQSSEVITLLSSRELEKMRKACQLAAQLLDYLAPMVKPGASTLELNDLAEDWTQQHGAKSAPLGYPGAVMPFPKSLCTSVNEVICHGIPRADEILKDGDIINTQSCQGRADLGGDPSDWPLSLGLEVQGSKPKSSEED